MKGTWGVMIKDNQKYFNQLHIVLDGLVVAASYLLAWFLKFEGLFSDGSTLAHPPSFYFSDHILYEQNVCTQAFSEA